MSNAITDVVDIIYDEPVVELHAKMLEELEPEMDVVELLTNVPVEEHIEDK